MKRNWNVSLWIGFAFAILGFVSYPLFIQFPITRDFPWANYLLFAAGGSLLILGLVRAFGRPQLYRGKVVGSILTVVALCAFAFFAYLTFYVLQDVPRSDAAPHVGQKAPEFTLPDQNGKQIALSDLTSGKAAVLIFYRGHW